MEKWMQLARSACWLVVLVSVCHGGNPEAEKQDVPREQGIFAPASGTVPPYCGVSCLYAILRLQGRDINYRDLLKGEYIGSYRGSSIVELKTAAEDAGLFAYPLGNMTLSDLRRSQHPVILHVKRSPTDRGYHHYVLFLGMDKGRVTLMNSSRIGQAGTEELLTRWGGSGLLISAHPVSRVSMFASSGRRFVPCALLTLMLVLALRFVRRCLPPGLFDSWKRRLAFSAGQCAVLGAAALVFAFAYHFVIREGLLASAGATEVTQRAYAGTFISTIGANRVNAMLASNSTVLVDARYRRDFEGGHLDGAINVPVNANDGQRHEAMAAVPKNAKIVVYCQSSGCSYAEKVAVKLKYDGYSDVSIFKGGWSEWSSRSQEKEATS